MAERKSNVVESPGEPSLKFSRVFDAPRHLVFEACTLKEHTDVWMRPNDFTVAASGGDFREGGDWHSRIISPQGEPHTMLGAYKKIVPDELLVYTHAWEGDDGKPGHWTTVTMRFEDAGAGKTKLIFEQSVFRSIESRDSHMDGWTQGFDKLDALLAKRQGKG
jgi:uncharacterized protein YndB with AHSA1/START domain